MHQQNSLSLAVPIAADCIDMKIFAVGLDRFKGAIKTPPRNSDVCRGERPGAANYEGEMLCSWSMAMLSTN
jgi:hypothetical protein